MPLDRVMRIGCHHIGTFSRTPLNALHFLVCLCFHVHVRAWAITPSRVGDSALVLQIVGVIDLHQRSYSPESGPGQPVGALQVTLPDLAYLSIVITLQHDYLEKMEIEISRAVRKFLSKHRSVGNKSRTEKRQSKHGSPGATNKLRDWATREESSPTTHLLLRLHTFDLHLLAGSSPSPTLTDRPFRRIRHKIFTWIANHICCFSPREP